ncbi:MAG: HDIG domain-containing protein [bacterium]|nr:HDIG domain-containing protein [bacterium]
MKREEALKLVNSKIKSKNLIKHSLAVEAAMREIANYLKENEDVWGIAGLLHDLDYEETKDDPTRHGMRTAELLTGKVDDCVLYAIKAHSGKVEPKSKLDIALYAIDPLTGLIVAACLMHPDKKLASLDKEFILRRFNEKRFAASVNRDQIKSCDKLGIKLELFVDLVLKGMQRINYEFDK